MKNDDDSFEKSDYHFGLSTNTNFLMPNIGEATHTGTDGQLGPMVFYFNGDDDFWVYVDDVLQLDIGGIHGASTGNINFQKGESTTEIGTTYMDTAYASAKGLTPTGSTTEELDA